VRFGRAVDKGSDETGVQADVDEASAWAETPCHVACDGSEVFYIGMEEHLNRYRHRLIPHRQKRASARTTATSLRRANRS